MQNEEIVSREANDEAKTKRGKRRDTQPWLSVHDNGAIAINAAACEKLGLKAGDDVEFGEIVGIKDSKGDECHGLYISKTSDTSVGLAATGHYATFRDQPTICPGGLVSFSKMAATFIKEKIGKDPIPGMKSLRVLLAGIPTEIDGHQYWGLL